MTSEKIDKQIVDDELLNTLRLISPGTGLRKSIDNISRAGTGALIVVGNIDKLKPILSGGFEVNCKFTPQRVVELCKMDGAVIIDDDSNRIIYANVLLIPDPSIPSEETGTRHQAAERTARQTKQLAISISEKKKTVNLYYGNMKYALRDTEELLNRAAEESRMLEKHKEVFKELIQKLNFLEFSNLASLNDIALAVQRAEIISRISDIIKKYIIQLGREGELIKIQLKELIKGIEDEELLILKDYSKRDFFTTKVELYDLTLEELIDSKKILEIMGYIGDEEQAIAKGYRMLNKTSLSKEQISDIISKFGNFNRISAASSEELLSIFDDEKIFNFQRELNKIKENTVF